MVGKVKCAMTKGSKGGKRALSVLGEDKPTHKRPKTVVVGLPLFIIDEWEPEVQLAA